MKTPSFDVGDDSGSCPPPKGEGLLRGTQPFDRPARAVVPHAQAGRELEGFVPPVRVAQDERGLGVSVLIRGPLLELRAHHAGLASRARLQIQRQFDVVGGRLQQEH